jgi:hypothetical protein
VKTLSAFRPRVSPHVAGASDALIDQAVLDTCIDFCERTLVVKRMLDTFPTVAGKREYDIDGPSQQSVAKVMRMWADDVELDAMAEDMADHDNFVTGTQRARPRFFNETDPGVIAFLPTPDAAYSINTRVALKPTRSATQVEDQLFDDWVEAIVDGALARLHMVAGTEFFSPTSSQFRAASYRAGVNNALIQATRGRTRAQLRVTPVRI